MSNQIDQNQPEIKPEPEKVLSLIQTKLAGLTGTYLKLLQFNDSKLNTHQKLLLTNLLLSYLLLLKQKDLENTPFLEALRVTLEEFVPLLPQLTATAPAGSCPIGCFLFEQMNRSSAEGYSGALKNPEMVVFCVSLFVQNAVEPNIRKKKYYLESFKKQSKKGADLRTIYHPIYHTFRNWMVRQKPEWLDLVTATRLSPQLITKLRLSYCVLTPNDTDVFMSYVISLLSSNVQDKRNEGIARSLLLLTALTPDDLGKLVVSNQLAEEQAGICLNLGIYRRCDLLLEGSYCRAKHSLTEKYYETHSHWVDLPLVEIVVLALRAWLESEGQRELKLSQLGDLSKLTGESPKWLISQIPSRKHWGSTYQRYLGFCALESRVGGSYASLILSNKVFNNLHTHFYSSALVSKSQQVYAECMSVLFKSPVHFSCESESVYHGDEFCVKGSFIKAGLEQLKLKVESHCGEVNQAESPKLWRKNVASMHELKAFYNHFTLYTFAYFALNVALRATSNISQSVVIDLERHFSVICEKEVKSDRPERYIPLDRELSHQLAQWQYLRNYMLNKLNIDHEVMPKIPLWSDGQWQDLSTRHLINEIFNDLTIKGDVFRHFMARSLIDNSKARLAPGILGHESLRHHSVGHFSLGTISDSDKSTAITEILQDNGLRNFELVSYATALKAEWSHKEYDYKVALKRYLSSESKVVATRYQLSELASSDEESTLLNFVSEVMSSTCYSTSVSKVFNSIERHCLSRCTLELGAGRLYQLRYIEQLVLKRYLGCWKVMLQVRMKELVALFDHVKGVQTQPVFSAHVNALAFDSIETTSLPQHRIESLLKGHSRNVTDVSEPSSTSWPRTPVSDFSDTALEAEITQWIDDIEEIQSTGRNIAVKIRLSLLKLLYRYLSDVEELQGELDELEAQVKNKERIKFCDNDFFRFLQTMLPEQVANVYAYCWYLTYQKGRGNRKNYALGTFKRHCPIFKAYLRAHKEQSKELDAVSVNEYYQRMKALTPTSSYSSLHLWFKAMNAEKNVPMPGEQASNVQQSVSNTMLLQHEYDDALALITNATEINEGDKLDLACQLILMFKLGYRNQEVTHLRIADMADSLTYLSLCKYPGYTPKSPAANRCIFAETSLSTLEKEIVTQAYQRAVKTGSNYLIASRTRSEHDAMSYRLTRLLKDVSGEPLMRLYDARKGYVNYHYLMLNQVYLPSVQRYFSAKNQSDMALIREAWLDANCSPNHRDSTALYALAVSAGHKYEAGLVKSYVHTSSLVVAMHQQDSFELGDTYWCMQVGLNRAHYTVTKVTKNSPERHYQSTSILIPRVNKLIQLEAPLEHRFTHFLKQMEKESNKPVYDINFFSQSLFDLKDVGFNYSNRRKSAFTNAGKKRCLDACSLLMPLPFDALLTLKESWFLIHRFRDGLIHSQYQQYRSKADNALSQAGLSRKSVCHFKSEVRGGEQSQLVCRFDEFCLALLCVVSFGRGSTEA
ncbi:hypothetical protein ACHFJ9_06225 [Vibrio sp. D3]|uniref:hypothetical protein n=1 Tax=Vibrio sp. D3 TaxID=3374281 RepID=UPI00375707A0